MSAHVSDFQVLQTCIVVAHCAEHDHWFGFASGRPFSFVVKQYAKIVCHNSLGSVSALTEGDTGIRALAKMVPTCSYLVLLAF